MAIADSSYVEISTNGLVPSMRRITDDKTVLIYDDVDAGYMSGIIIDNSGATPSLGAKNQVWDGLRSGDGQDVAVISSTKIVVIANPSGTSEVRMRTMSISGNTITEQAIETVEAINGLDYRIAMISGGTGLAAYRNVSGSTHRLCRFTISGDTVVAGTPQTHGTHTVARPIGMCKLDSSRVFYVYHITGNDIYVQVIDISSGITEGTPVRIGTRDVDFTFTHYQSCLKVDTNKCFVFWLDSSSVEVCAALITTTIGTAIDTIGTVLVIDSGANCSAGAPDLIDTDTIAICYRDSSAGGFIGTLNVSGTTLTENGDEIQADFAPFKGGRMQTLTSSNLSEGEAVYTHVENIVQDFRASKITGLPQAAAEAAACPTGQFYFGLGALAYKFDMPFGVQPHGMTLDQSLGTVVAGANCADTTGSVLYSQFPYESYTLTDDGLATGTIVQAIKWI